MPTPAKTTRRMPDSYWAGIVDGEGCIRIAKCTRPAHRLGVEYEIRVQVLMTSLDVILGLKGAFGGSIHKARKISNRKQIYMWKVATRQAYRCVRKIRRFLIVKAEQADLIIGFQENLVGRHGKPVSIGLQAMREAAYLKSLSLNSGHAERLSAEAPFGVMRQSELHRNQDAEGEPKRLPAGDEPVVKVTA